MKGIDLMIDLQPINFTEIKNDRKLTVYEARIEYPAEPYAPVYALTATTIAPESSEEKAELEEVLNAMRAAFTLQSGPVIGESDDTPERLDWPNEIKFQPSVISIGHEGPVSVAVTVEAAIGDDEGTTADDELTAGSDEIATGDDETPGEADVQIEAHTVTLRPKHRNHHWHSSSGYATQATVNVGLGSGTLSPPPTPSNPIGPGATYRTTSKTVVVHAYKRLRYTIGGSFSYPPN
jgi:hypothetical protein